MSSQTYAELVQGGLAALATNSGVILDATFSSRAQREYLRDECAKAHVHLQVVELETKKSEIAKRLKARGQRTEEISDARLEDFEKLSAAYEPPLELAPDLIEISTTAAVTDSVNALLRRLAAKEASASS